VEREKGTGVVSTTNPKAGVALGKIFSGREIAVAAYGIRRIAIISGRV